MTKQFKFLPDSTLSIKNNLMAWHERLKKAVDASPFSQAEIARRMNVTPQTIHNWTKGKASPAVDVFLDLCELIEAAPGPIIDESIPEPGENLISDTLQDQIEKLGESEALRRILLTPGAVGASGETKILRTRDETHLEQLPPPPRNHKRPKTPGDKPTPRPGTPTGDSTPEDGHLLDASVRGLNQPRTTGKKRNR
jgi:transcriptional regulator with XRE-family HTH domain